MNVGTLPRHALLLILVVPTSIVGPAQATTEVAGVRFDERIRLGTGELQLNGAGVREKFIFKAYAIGLYLAEKKFSAEEALALEGPKRLHIVTLRDLSAEQFADAMVEGVRKNHSENENENLHARVEAFKTAILAVKSTARGSLIVIDWLPGNGTRLSIDGQQKSGDIAGEDFFRALLKIWVGPKPVQNDLKDALLGNQ